MVGVMAMIIGLAVSSAYAKQWKLRSADVVEPASPYTIGMNKFCETVKEKTKGQVQIKHFPGGQLGSDMAIVEGVKLGNIDLAISGATGSKAADAMALLYLFKDAEHQRKVIQGPIGEKIKKLIEIETGLVDIGMVYFAPRQLTTTKREVKSLEDLKGLKIRVPLGPPMVAGWKALGASPTPMAFTELFSALQQGVVDGQENPYQIIFDSSFFEVQKYLMETNHNILVRHLFVNKGLWKDIGETNQKVMLEAWKEAALMIERMYLEKDEEYKRKLKEKGMLIVKPDVEAFRKATENVWKDFAPQAWGTGVYEEIQKLR
jgi:tripartite ATP-independent transporter DctP family solute receptor